MLKNKSSLYRIYRPSTFSDVVGHNNVVEILKKELKDNAFGHAFLFAGQKGTGKTSIARIVAKSVNCLQLIDGESCEKCDNCLLANEGKFPDIYEIDAASNNGVDEIRNIKSNVSTLPLKGKYKIYIIDEVHMLSKGAFNALLKTLEEPPVHALFILATTEFSKIPQTIVSRCQTFNFKKIDKKSLIERLDYIVKKENFVLDLDAAEEIYFLSDGSLRDALNILEQLMIFNDHQISLDSLKKVFYVASKKEKIKVINDVLNNNVHDLISYFENAENQGMDFDNFTLGLIEIIKEIIEFKLTNNLDFLKILTIEDIDNINNLDLDKYFFIADQLSNAYSKTKGSNVSFNYILISLLKSVSYRENIETQKEIQHNSDNDSVMPPIDLVKEKPNEIPQVIDLVANDNEKEKIKEELELNLKKDNEKQVLNESKSDFELKDEILAKNVNNLIENKLKLISSFSNKKYMIIDNNNIVNLLVEASKKNRDVINQKVEAWFKVDDSNNLLNVELANYFIAFYGSKISAASDCEILVRFETEPGANLLKKELINVAYQKKLKEEFGGNYVLYIIDDDQWETIKKEFLFKKKSDSLPNHEHINNIDFYKSAIEQEKKIDKTEDFLEKASELFGEDIEIGD